MDWWVSSSLDLEGARKYNRAARWLLRQSGVVRQRGEEYTPKELEYQKEMKGKDEEGNEIVLVEEDLLFGLHKTIEFTRTNKWAHKARQEGRTTESLLPAAWPATR